MSVYNLTNDDNNCHLDGFNFCSRNYATRACSSAATIHASVAIFILNIKFFFFGLGFDVITYLFASKELLWPKLCER